MFEDQKESIREAVREMIEEKANQLVMEKYGKKKKVSEEEDDEEEDENDDDTHQEGDGENTDKDDPEDESDEEDPDEGKQVSESMKVTAYSHGSKKQEEMDVNSLRELSALAKTRKYSSFEVVNRGRKSEYAVDPQGNLVEL